jgi:putative membrane protein
MKAPLTMTTAFLGSILPFATLASAQRGDWGGGPWGGGPWGMHYMMGSFGVGMMLFMLIFWVLIIAGGVALVRWLWSGTGGSSPVSNGRETAEDILKKRYAKGEIDKPEFEAKMGDIRKA